MRRFVALCLLFAGCISSPPTGGTVDDATSPATDADAAAPAPDADTGDGNNGTTDAAGPDAAADFASSDASAGDASSDQGPCVPEDEICNGRDDDCDGTTDEGCPRSLGTAAPIQLGTFGVAGDSGQTAACDVGQALVGVDLCQDPDGESLFTGVVTRCTKPALQVDDSIVPHAYFAGHAALVEDNIVGDCTGPRLSFTCPAPEFLTSIQFSADESSFQFRCGKLDVVADADIWTVDARLATVSACYGTMDCQTGELVGCGGRGGTLQLNAVRFDAAGVVVGGLLACQGFEVDTIPQ